MCFGKAIWLGRSLSETRCNVIAVRLLTIAVLQPIASPVLSISCRLITPYIRPFWLKNDGTVVTTRAHCLRCVVCSHGAAVLVHSSRFGVPAIARDCGRASCTSWCDDTRGLCAQQWFG